MIKCGGKRLLDCVNSVVQQNQSWVIFSDMVLALPNMTIRALNKPHVHTVAFKDKKGPCVPCSPKIALAD